MTQQLFEGLDGRLRQRLLQRVAGKTVCLPEGQDPRVQQAALVLESHCGVRTMVLGPNVASRLDPRDVRDVVCRAYARRAKAEPPTSVLDEMVQDPLVVAGAALAMGQCDAVVAGSVAETARVIKAVLATVGLAHGVATLTSAFVMNLRQPTAGGQNPLLFADAGVVPDPTSEQLVDIAAQAAGAFECWFGDKPVVAMLSFSTFGSASGPQVEKVRRATSMLRHRHPQLAVFGEVQLDAAVEPQVAERKIPKEQLGELPPGGANVLVFPDLDAGNICYKAVERLGGASAWGPVLLGGARPYADLSRGCSPLDIVHVACLALALT